MSGKFLKVFKRESSEASFKMLLEFKKEKITKSVNKSFPLAMKIWITSYYDRSTSSDSTFKI